MNLIKWNDFNQLDSFFEDFPFLSQRAVKSPAMDVYEEDGKLVVDASLPGFNKEDINVSVEDGYLNISAQHKEEKEEKKKHYYSKEIRTGVVSRMVRLPEGADQDKVEAEYKDGILKITIPHKESVKELPSKQVEIK